MLMIDLRHSRARITLQEILASGRKYVSNPIAFHAFASGLRPVPDLLLDQRLQSSGSVSGRFAFFRTVMFDILPTIYDVRHLETLGGRFALRLTGVGDYTVIAMNRRVVTLSGLPLDETTGAPVIDAQMRPDVFMALCNEMMAALSESVLNSLAAAGAGAQTPALSSAQALPGTSFPRRT